MQKLNASYLSGFKKVTGLIFEKKAYPVIFKTRFGIHTFGMRFPIDVLILNKENQIIKLRPNMQPNSVFFWSPIFDTVIELPEGEISIHKIKLGETIKIDII